MNESQKLIDLIETSLTPITTNDGVLSIQDALLQIFSIIRPILETMRNSLRNLLLFRQQSSNEWIEMSTVTPAVISTRCLICPLNLEQVSEFWDQHRKTSLH